MSEEETVKDVRRIIAAAREHMDECDDPDCHLRLALKKAFPRET